MNLAEIVESSGRSRGVARVMLVLWLRSVTLAFGITAAGGIMNGAADNSAALFEPRKEPGGNQYRCKTRLH